MDCVVGAKYSSQLAAGLVSLLPSFLCQLDSVVRDRLVDVAVFCEVGDLLVLVPVLAGSKVGLHRPVGRTVSFRLSMSDQDDKPWFSHG